MAEEEEGMGTYTITYSNPQIHRSTLQLSSSQSALSIRGVSIIDKRACRTAPPLIGYRIEETRLRLGLGSGQAIRVHSYQIVKSVVVGANETSAIPLRVLFSQEHGWLTDDCTQGSGVVMVVENAGQHPFVDVCGAFNL